MTRSLVLNATYEPLSVVPSRRAVVLVISDKAETISVTGRVLRAERLVIDEPSVVRLSRFVRAPHPRTRSLNRRAVFVRDDYVCQYCGSHADSLDHVVPRSRGGTHTWDNVVAACRRCNMQKRDRMLADTPMHLRHAPRPPHASIWFRLAERTVPVAWLPYLEPAAAAERTA
jgi:5-methylcytosine-specific restriction endonuclease McrA